MKIAENILELIGKTPLVKFNDKRKELKGNLILKLESFNPAGSIKDRVAMNMIEEAERSGEIEPKRTTLIEPTSGNTGIGLALVAIIKGYKLIVVMPENMSTERQKLIKAYGAEIVLTEKSKGMKGAIEKANELEKSIANAKILQQFENPANPQTHEKTTGKEIWEDTEGEVNFVIAGVGTGGTLTGIARYLKKKNSDIKMVAVEPESSAVLNGKAAGTHKLQGIGAGFIPKTCEPKYFDEVMTVSDNSAIETARELGREQGILCGISGGAAVFAGMEVAKRAENAGKNIVVIIPDNGEKYLSTELFCK